MRMRSILLPALLGSALAAVGRPAMPASAGLHPAEPLLDGSEFATRLYPQFTDYDGDGRIDMLVGVGERLRMSRNTGSNTCPVYAAGTWLDDREPSALIPDG